MMTDAWKQHHAHQTTFLGNSHSPEVTRHLGLTARHRLAILPRQHMTFGKAGIDQEERIRRGPVREDPG